MLKLSAQVTNGGPCRNFAYYFMLIILATQKGGHGTMPPPLNTPLGGLFWRLKTKLNDLDPDFDWSSLRLKRFFSQNHVISKKEEGLHVGWDALFLVHIISGSSPSLIPITFGEAIFVFSAEISLKSAKNTVFCILFRPMGKTRVPPPPPPPPPPPFLATLLVTDIYFVRFLLFKFWYS